MNRSFANPRTVCALGACGVAMLLTTGAVAAPSDGQLGGAPSTDLAEADCPGGTAITGLTGEVGDVGGNTIVATIQLNCAGGGTPTGEELGDSATHAETGTGFTSCDTGDVAVGIVGREGDFLDQIALRCQDASLTGPITDAISFGGPGGGADGPYDCPAGQQLVGLDGSEEFTDQVVRHVQIVCAVPPVAGRCAGRDATQAGTPGNDVIVGTPARDVIVGLAGRDTIRGLGAKDRLCGNAGRDKLSGGGGNDVLQGARGNDRLNGGSGRDKCSGGPGNDRARNCEIERSI
jgi:Ca2+-binding RTX toxin-like protein